MLRRLECVSELLTSHLRARERAQFCINLREQRALSGGLAVLNGLEKESDIGQVGVLPGSGTGGETKAPLGQTSHGCLLSVFSFASGAAISSHVGARQESASGRGGSGGPCDWWWLQGCHERTNPDLSCAVCDGSHCG